MMNKGLDNGQDLPHELLTVWDLLHCYGCHSNCVIRIITIASRGTHSHDLKMEVIWLKHSLALTIKAGWSKKVVNTKIGKDDGLFLPIIVSTILNPLK